MLPLLARRFLAGESAQRDLDGRREVWQYVPCGSRWLSHFYRRVTEDVCNTIFVRRALLG
jgi:proline dehydrogenase